MLGWVYCMCLVSLPNVILNVFKDHYSIWKPCEIGCINKVSPLCIPHKARKMIILWKRSFHIDWSPQCVSSYAYSVCYSVRKPSHIAYIDMASPQYIVLKCLFTEMALPHSLHWYGFSLICVLISIFNVLFTEKSLSHWLHWYCSPQHVLVTVLFLFMITIKCKILYHICCIDMSSLISFF